MRLVVAAYFSLQDRIDQYPQARDQMTIDLVGNLTIDQAYAALVVESAFIAPKSSLKPRQQLDDMTPDNRYLPPGRAIEDGPLRERVSEMPDVKAVILAGGLGTRLSEETSSRPKPMVEIGGRPILLHIMNIYSHFGIKDFVICAGYKGYMIKEYFANYALHNSDVFVDLTRNEVTFSAGKLPPWRIHVVDTGETTMTGGRVRRIRHLVADDPYFLLTYGDGLSDIDIAGSIDFHQKHGRKATMTVVRPSARFGSTRIENGMVCEFQEKPQTEQGLINGGFFVLSPSVIDLIDGDDTTWEQDPLRTLAAKGELAAWPHDGFWQPMDTLREKHMLEELWATGNAPWLHSGK